MTACWYAVGMRFLCYYYFLSPIDFLYITYFFENYYFYVKEIYFIIVNFVFLQIFPNKFHRKALKRDKMFI